MRFLILNTDYSEFLDWLYLQHPGLEHQPYEEQMRARVESRFGVADFYSNNLRKLGHEAWDIYANNEIMQRAWAQEYGQRVDSDWRWQFRLRRGIVPWVSRVKEQGWFYNILAAQIKYYKPDVLLNQEMSGISSRFLGEMKPYVRLLVGQHAASQLSDMENWSVYDLVNSSFPPTLEWFRLKGVPGELIRLGFEPRVLSHLKDGERNIPISFVGSLYPVIHSTRLQWLEHLCSAFQVRVWSGDVTHLPTSSSIVRSYVGPAWGTEMYEVLRRSFVTLNNHGNPSPHANNLRLYEATGVGTLLITDWKVNLHEMFEPDKEVVAYRSPEECAELIQYYMEHDEERATIARNGQQRTLRKHTYYQRMQELVDIVHRYS